MNQRFSLTNVPYQTGFILFQFVILQDFCIRVTNSYFFNILQVEYYIYFRPFCVLDTYRTFQEQTMIIMSLLCGVLCQQGAHVTRVSVIELPTTGRTITRRSFPWFFSADHQEWIRVSLWFHSQCTEGRCQQYDVTSILSSHRAEISRVHCRNGKKECIWASPCFFSEITSRVFYQRISKVHVFRKIAKFYIRLCYIIIIIYRHTINVNKTCKRTCYQKCLNDTARRISYFVHPYPTSLFALLYSKL